MRKRTSIVLTELKRELHQRALKETDEKRRKDYWRMYFAARNAEGEVRELVMEAEIRRLKEFLRDDGPVDDVSPSEQPTADDMPDEDDIPPRQKGLWEE